MESFAGFIAGFAFFLVGLKMFSANLNQITSRRFRVLMTQFTPNGWMAGLWGIVLSLLTAGNTVLTPCITAGFETVHAINYRKSIQIVVWSRVGACFFIYLAGFNIKLLILFLMGIAGISFAINKPKKFVALASSIFNLGLVLFGILLIKSSTKILTKFDWFLQVVDYTQQFPEIAFVAGFVFLMCSQSLFGSLVIALSFLDSGVFGLEQAVLFTLGVYLGEGVLKVFYLSAFQGIFRQVMALLPIIYFSAFLMGTVTYVMEVMTGIPMIQSLSHLLANNDRQVLANVNFLIHLVTAIALSLTVAQVEDFVYRMVGNADSGEDYQEVNIPKEVLDDPITTIALIEKEELRLVKDFPVYMENIRIEKSKEDTLVHSDLHGRLHNDLEILRGVYSGLLKRNQYHQNISSSILHGIERQNLLISLEENLFEFSLVIEKLRGFAKDNRSLDDKFLQFVEALDATILTMIDVLENPKEAFNITILRKITTGREDLMKHIRDAYSDQLSAEERVDLIKLTNLFESSIWIIQKIDTVLEEAGELLEARES